jgi:hypothetical protein
MAKVPNDNARRGSRRLRLINFQPPKRISDDQFLEACEGFGIPDEIRKSAKVYLDDLVDEFCGWMKEQGRRNRFNDLKRIQKAQYWISLAGDKLHALDRDGRDALRYSGSEPLGRMFSADWVTHHFPNDAPTRQTERSIMRGRSGYYEGQKDAFIQNRAPEALKALLQDVVSRLDSAVRSLRSPSGQRPLIYRHYFIVNLANFWQDIGKKVVSTPGSQFEIFCEYIFKAVGWPTDGLPNAISDAVKDWLHLPKNRARLSK